jgi:hypothetical protein
MAAIIGMVEWHGRHSLELRTCESAPAAQPATQPHKRRAHAAAAIHAGHRATSSQVAHKLESQLPHDGPSWQQEAGLGNGAGRES